MILEILFVILLNFVGIFGDSDKCSEPMDPGPCQYYQLKWYWDSKNERCTEFYYGGCLGTKNKFNTKQECIKQCIFKEHNPVTIPDFCLLDPDPGRCPNSEKNGQWWYYFNAINGICEQFFYYGCGGNNNKFYSLYQCRKVCGERLSPQVACDRCDVRTSDCKQISKYNYTCECRKGYQKNVYGECEDIDECRQNLAECHANAWCTNTIGSHTCQCMAGYVGDGYKCTFVGIGKTTDDCKKCHPNAECKNGVCQCKIGFKGDGFICSDVNECLRNPNPCDPKAKCKNVPGSFICECPVGYAGNGYNCTKDSKACLDKFDRNYQETCSGENWRENYYLDHTSKRCGMFWYDGCPGKSMNIFNDLQSCENLCEKTNVLTRSEICWDNFDPNYRNQCLSGEWQQKYYFDHASLTCRLFWYDGCHGTSRNMFDDLLTCQWLCEEQPRYNSKSCLETFDEHYRDECNGGKWRQQYYFDKTTKKCTTFWYDGCTGTSQNIFQDQITCVQLCETPANKALEQESDKSRNYYESRTSGEVETFETEYRIDSKEREKQFKSGEITKTKIHSHRQKEYKQRHRGDEFDERNTNTTKVSKMTNPENICEVSNPCENNGTCIFDSKKRMYYCKCSFGYTNDNCTERIDTDPCASNPCQNGATCAAKASNSKTTYECICLPDFGGINCESRPCDDEPCKNNGTCRTTRSSPAFFCDCIGEWGGKHCELPIPKISKSKYGKNVRLVSSGQPEWIEELKKRKTKAPIEHKPIRTAKNKEKMILESEVEETTQIASSAELMAAVTNDTLDLDNSLVAGQTGGEITSHTLSQQLTNLTFFALIIFEFLKLIFA